MQRRPCLLSWAGLCAEHGGLETTDQGARDFWSQDSSSLFFSAIQGSLVFVTTLPRRVAQGEAALSWDRQGQVWSLLPGLLGLQLAPRWLAHLSCSLTVVAA